MTDNSIPTPAIFTFKCHGRDACDNETLDVPVPVIVTIRQNPMRSVISTSVQCQFITGGHGQRCRASHQQEEDHDKQGNKIYCPYVTSLGHIDGTYKNPLPVHRDY